MQDVFIAGYSDKLSVRPSETITFFVSSRAGSDFKATLHRSISADPNPDGPGIVEQDASIYFRSSSFASRYQGFTPGSFAQSTTDLRAKINTDLLIKLWFMPTVLVSADQTLIAWGHVSIILDSQGIITAKLLGGMSVSTTVEVKCNQWHSLELTVLASGMMTLDVKSMMMAKANIGDTKSSRTELGIAQMFPLLVTAPVRIAAGFGDAPCCFNGKIEAPEILVDGALIAKWDFAQSISSLSVKAHTGPDLLLRNAPTRGVTGCKWDATEFCWRHKPAHYAAILFHDDDIYDFGWDKDFEFVVPDDMPSGIYIMRIEAEGHYDAMPFFVCPPLGKRRADLCVLVSTFTYTIYGNHARPDFAPSWLEKISAWNAYPNNPSEYRHYGLSTYNNHTDGSGICHASHKRVLFNLRPGYLTFGEASCSGLRHFQADSHLIAWLHNQDIAYDIVTDDELDRDGVAAISGYKAVLTGSHPEYHTSATLDALKDYRDNGGGLIYLGGNGFYWRIVRHSEEPTLLEIRRSEDGLRAWASEPGEYYNAFDGSYGGLWRRNGRPPQKLVGIGFTAQGNFVGMPYKRVNYDKNMDWVFDGINGELLGDFGFSGHGAAGFELDRRDEKLDEGQDIITLAQSYDEGNRFILVPEEMLTHLTNLSGSPEADAKRADMVYFKTANGGQVFAVGSITFCGSLPWNNYDNNISTLLRNVVRKFVGS
ncbi:N,N-dimethylformamidase large subunit [Alphaproteobacteria bacterium]|jgi:N,N-dimethylformamidase|nr:N,N-dimethylformamidase large subunit [Alphaproteobacteria bacterium]